MNQWFLKVIFIFSLSLLPACFTSGDSKDLLEEAGSFSVEENSPGIPTPSPADPKTNRLIGIFKILRRDKG